MYCDEINTDYCLIASTYLAAKKFKLERLAGGLLNHCTNNLRIDNCAIIYDQLLKMPDHTTHPKSYYVRCCEQLISMHTFLVFRSPLFIKISKETLIKIIKGDKLFIKEIDLFLACLRWIKTNFR